MQDTLGYIAAILIGVTLGLIGAGGSILTVPILVYLMGVKPVTATAYSLFVVGLTALVGALAYMRQELVSYRIALLFSVPSFIGVFLARRFIMPAIPSEIGYVGEFLITKNFSVMVLFAILMLLGSISMIRQRETIEKTPVRRFNRTLIFAEGFAVGLLTGLIGAGGGFLIIPALVVLAKLPMKLVVGTSLLIIAVKSLLGFTGDLGQVNINWSLLLQFSLFAVVGIFIGSYASRFISGGKLKPAFGWFVLAMGVYVIVREVVGGSGWAP